MASKIRNRGSVPVADISSGEIVRRGRPIRIAGEFSERDINAVVVTGGGSADVSFDAGGLIIDTSGLAIGGHTVLVNGIPASSKVKGRQDTAVDLIVVETPASFDDGFAVFHSTRIRIGELDIDSLPMAAGTDGEFRDIFKVVARDGTKADTLAFDQSGERVDIDEELAAFAKRRQDRYGRIEPALYDDLERGGEVDGWSRRACTREIRETTGAEARPQRQTNNHGMDRAR